MSWIELVFIGFCLGAGATVSLGHVIKSRKRRPQIRQTYSDNPPRQKKQTYSDMAAAAGQSSSPGYDYSRPAQTTRPGDSELIVESGKGKIIWRSPSWVAALVAAAVLIAAVIAWVLWNRSSQNADKPPQVIISPVISPVINPIPSGTPIERDHYKIESSPVQPQVEGVQGKMYLLELKDGDKENLFKFQINRYDQAWTSSFFNAMKDVQSDVLNYLDKNGVEYTIFLRGSADHSGWEAAYIGKLLDSDSVKIQYLPNKNPHDEWLFSQQPRQMTVSSPYRNDELPNLRAWFIQQKLQRISIPSIILNGSVTPNDKEPDDRNVYLLLCIHWKQPPS